MAPRTACVQLCCTACEREGLAWAAAAAAHEWRNSQCVHAVVSRHVDCARSSLVLENGRSGCQRWRWRAVHAAPVVTCATCVSWTTRCGASCDWVRCRGVIVFVKVNTTRCGAHHAGDGVWHHRELGAWLGRVVSVVMGWSVGVASTLRAASVDSRLCACVTMLCRRIGMPNRLSVTIRSHFDREPLCTHSAIAHKHCTATPRHLRQAAVNPGLKSATLQRATTNRTGCPTEPAVPKPGVAAPEERTCEVAQARGRGRGLEVQSACARWEAAAFDRAQA